MNTSYIQGTHTISCYSDDSFQFGTHPSKGNFVITPRSNILYFYNSSEELNDIFKTVYENYGNKNISFNEWKILIGKKYIKYMIN